MKSNHRLIIGAGAAALSATLIWNLARHGSDNNHFQLDDVPQESKADGALRDRAMPLIKTVTAPAPPSRNFVPVDAALESANDPTRSTPLPPATPLSSSTTNPSINASSFIDGSELRTEEGHLCRIDRLAAHPDVAVLTLGDGSRYALPTEIVEQFLSAPGLDDTQKLAALLSYPNLVEASTAQETVRKLAKAESRKLPLPPPDAVDSEIMENATLRSMAFKIPEEVQPSLESGPTSEE